MLVPTIEMLKTLNRYTINYANTKIDILKSFLLQLMLIFPLF